MDLIYKQADEFMTNILAIASTIPAKVSTITIAVNTASQGFDLSKILEEFNTLKIKEFIYDVTGAKDSIVVSNKKQFFNSIIFKCNNIPTEEDGYILVKQAVKVFCNGSLHITGVKNIKDAIYLAEVFLTMIELMYDGDGLSYMFKITGFEVQLMNFYFKLSGMLNGYVLRLVDVRNCLRQNTSYSVSYNNERHAGVIIRTPTFSLLIFDTGNVIVCSIQDTLQLKEAKDFIQNNIVSLPSLCLIKKDCIVCKKQRKDRDKVFDYANYLVLK